MYLSISQFTEANPWRTLTEHKRAIISTTLPPIPLFTALTERLAIRKRKNLKQGTAKKAILTPASLSGSYSDPHELQIHLIHLIFIYLKDVYSRGSGTKSCV